MAKVKISANVLVLGVNEATGGILTSVSKDVYAKPHPDFDKDKKMHKVFFKVIEGQKVPFKVGDVLVTVLGKSFIVPKAVYETEDKPPKKIKALE